MRRTDTDFEIDPFDSEEELDETGEETECERCGELGVYDAGRCEGCTEAEDAHLVEVVDAHLERSLRAIVPLPYAPITREAAVAIAASASDDVREAIGEAWDEEDSIEIPDPAAQDPNWSDVVSHLVDSYPDEALALLRLVNAR